MNSDSSPNLDPEKEPEIIPEENQELENNITQELVIIKELDSSSSAEQLTEKITQLQSQKQALEAEIIALQERKNQMLSQTIAEVEQTLSSLVKEQVQQLEQRKQELLASIEQLERRQERIRQEMRTNFVGVSQEIAVRVQGFKDYLVGSLQDLAAVAEQLELPSFDNWASAKPVKEQPSVEQSPQPLVAKTTFEEQAQLIRKLLEQYRTRPDYYGPPWQLRRTFEPIHSQRVQSWFFTQGGRGATRTIGSRLQNILVASAITSVLHKIHGDRLRTLVLADTPEKLGEWRRGLQDCLGISRSDFGPNRGVSLFESPESIALKAERLVEEKEIPLIIIDETENQINLSLLQFPLWLAFAPEPQQMSSYSY